MVGPKTITVNGSRVTAKHPGWLGLDMSNAEPRQQSSLMLFAVGSNTPIDVHLRVPFQHPGDTVDSGCFYRVRPKMEVGKKWEEKIVKSVAFERWGDAWYIAVELESEGERDKPAPQRRPGNAQSI